jgi:hypothetical protein
MKYSEFFVFTKDSDLSTWGLQYAMKEPSRGILLVVMECPVYVT